MPVQFQERLLPVIEHLRPKAQKLCNNTADAEDLIHDTYLKAIDNKDKFCEGNLYAWCYFMMKNIFINAYRRKVSHGVKSIEDAGIYDKRTVEINSLDLEFLSEALKKIDATAFRLIELRIWGYKYAEIAEILDIPIGTVKSQLHDCRKLYTKFVREVYNEQDEQ